MKGKLFVGALLVSLAVGNQGFGFELMGRMLGLNSGGCCEPACCEPACEQPACEPACEPACGDPCCKPRCDLFAGLKGLLGRKSCCDPCAGVAACEEVQACCPEPAACEEVQACCPEPAACDPACGDPCCKPKRCRRPLLDALHGMFGRKKCCCDPGCCQPAGCGAVMIQGGGEATGPAPAMAPEEEAAPLPPAPVADPSAMVRPPQTILQASRRVVLPY